MGLKGQLEDLPLLDMLQIIAFSKKSGYLRVAGPPGRGAVMLKEGRVLFSYSWSTVSTIRGLVADPGRITPELIRGCIETSLRELGGLREGSFQFELTDTISDELGGVRIKPFLLEHGLDPQELLLDLAVEIDNERREATSLMELAFHGTPPPEQDYETDEPATADPEPLADAPPAATPPVVTPGLPAAARAVANPPSALDVTVVLVDDEQPVTEVVGRELKQKGYRVYAAESPGRGAELVRRRLAGGERVLVVVDLKMPTSSGRSFYGGFELVRKLKSLDESVPVLLMVESLSDKAKARAKELGIRRVVHKPTLTKIDPELYYNDLRQFALAIDDQLVKLTSDLEPSTWRNSNGGVRGPVRTDVSRTEYLALMTRKLVNPRGSEDVSRLVLEVAGKFLERGLLFVVKGDVARGLAGYGLAADAAECAAIARKVQIDIGTCEPAAEVVRTGSAFRVTHDFTSLEKPLFSVVGRGRGTDAVFIPLLYNSATLLLLFGDNSVSGDSLGELGALELFMAQAGMALENKLLQQKLGTADAVANRVGLAARG